MSEPSNRHSLAPLHIGETPPRWGNIVKYTLELLSKGFFILRDLILRNMDGVLEDDCVFPVKEWSYPWHIFQKYVPSVISFQLEATCPYQFYFMFQNKPGSLMFV